jgi:hypothetical protein
MQSLCARVGDLMPIANLDLYDGRKRYRWYNGIVPPPPEAASCATAP